jgi:hypothetical protein
MLWDVPGCSDMFRCYEMSQLVIAEAVRRAAVWIVNVVVWYPTYIRLRTSSVYTSVYYFSGGDRVRIQIVFLQSAWLLADSPCVFAENFSCRFCSHPRMICTLPSRLVSYDAQVFAMPMLYCFLRGECLLASCVDVWFSRTLLRLLTKVLVVVCALIRGWCAPCLLLRFLWYSCLKCGCRIVTHRGECLLVSCVDVYF